MTEKAGKVAEKSNAKSGNVDTTTHQSLYRKYRPHTFADVVGQKQIVTALMEQIESGKVGHAYLFAGSRGLGKTSIARIFAHELNTSDKDLYEIDAASNNSVDDIRQLTENVYTLPFDSKYKVYILDEAHMLSKGAWNAFLKTLEEPPAHALFILATTELSKVPETVLSRCQVFQFKKPTRTILAEHIAAIAKKEGYDMELSAADLVAMLGDGSYRDALSVLEKILARIGGNNANKNAGNIITRAEAEEATGAPNAELVHAVVLGMHEGNTEATLVAIRAAAKQDIDMALYLSLVIDEVRSILLIRFAPELRKEIAEEMGEPYVEFERVALASGSKLAPQALAALLTAREQQLFSPIPSLPLELAILELYS